MRAFVVTGLTLLTVVSAAAAADRSRSAVPLTIDAHGGIVVQVRVNGSGPFKFILDTGASRSVVADNLARELGAPVVAKSEVVTSAGSDVRLVVRLTSVALDGSRVDALLAPVLPAANLAQLGRGVRGLLGQDFLSAFNYTLDYRRSRLTWDEPLACDGAGAVPLTSAEGRFVLEAESAPGQRLRLVPDSGAEVAVLFRGATPVQPISRVQVGATTLRGLRTVVVDRDDENADGLLPLHGFASVSFAASGACLVART